MNDTPLRDGDAIIQGSVAARRKCLSPIPFRARQFLITVSSIMAKQARRNRDAVPPSAAPEPNVVVADLSLRGVAACFFLSGLAALLYQTAWLRQFAISFGTSEFAVIMVLAAYMGGLAVGAQVAGRYVGRIGRPILVYGLLELGIAVSALCVPLLLSLAWTAHVAILGGQASPPASGGGVTSAVYLLMAFMALLLPTGLMGATLPLLARHAVRRAADIGPRIGFLYAINTVGAVTGTLIAAFVLLPKLGLAATVWCGVFVNFMVFVLAAAIARKLSPAMLDAATERPQPWSGFVPALVTAWRHARESNPFMQMLRDPIWLLPIMFLSGMLAFIYEVLWTRLLGHVLGGSIFAFATMLASFLAGIAIGSAVGARLAVTQVRAHQVFYITQIGIALMSIAIYLGFAHLVPEHGGLKGNVLLAAVILLPATLFIGATFPLAVRIVVHDQEMAASGSASVYAWNTAGAIAGAVLAGFLMIPALRYTGTIKVAVVGNLLLALWAAYLIRPSNRKAVIAAALLVAGVTAFFQPNRLDAVVNASPLQNMPGGHEMNYGVGRNATVLMLEINGSFNLRTNGLPEASASSKGQPPYKHSQQWLSALPVLARPDARSVLIIGFGGGVTIEGVPPAVETIDVIELEPEVIAANRAISARRQKDPFADPRVNIIINDARGALALTDKRYDVIVSQPSHPWTAGASHLYTREFLEIVRSHLTPDGVFLQWMCVTCVDKALFRTLAATIIDAFPYARMYRPYPDELMFVAGDSPVDIERTVVASGWSGGEWPAHYSAIGINSVEDLMATLALDEAGLAAFAGTAAVNTDDNNRLALHSHTQMAGLQADAVNALLLPHDPLTHADNWLFESQDADINFGYLTNRLLTLGFDYRAIAMLDAIPDRAAAALSAGLGLSAAGKRVQARQAIRDGLRLDPGSQQARFALLTDSLTELAANTAPMELIEAAALLEGSARAVVRGWEYGYDRQWAGIYRLEPLLAQARPTDLWYPLAVKLRAEWRTKVSTQQPQLALQAIDIIDRAIATHHATDLFVLRAGSAVIAGKPRYFVETAAVLAGLITTKLDRVKHNEYQFFPGELNIMHLRVTGILAGLRSAGEAMPATRYRVEEVTATYEKLVERVSKLIKSRG